MGLEGLTTPPRPGEPRPAFVSRTGKAFRGAVHGWRRILGTVWCPVCGADLDITPFPFWRRLFGLATYREVEARYDRVRLLEAELARVRSENDSLRDELLRGTEGPYMDGVSIGIEVGKDLYDKED